MTTSGVKTWTLGEIADHIGGELHGDPATPIIGADTIREAKSGQITFAHHPKYAETLALSEASAAIINNTFTPTSHPYIVVEDVAEAFATVVTCFRPVRPAPKPGVHPAAVVEPTAEVDPSAHVGPNCYVGDEVVIGPNTRILPGAVVSAGSIIGADTIVGSNVVIYENTQIGDRVILHGNATIGAYGFGYDSSTGKHLLSQQLGNVVIEDDVEIGANSTVDRGTYGSTVIGEGTKVDNLVQIAHNCRIGKHNMFCSQVGVAGSAVTGDYVVMAGQVGVRDHVDIGDGVRLGAKSGVRGDIPAGETFLGTPAMPERQQIQLMIALTKLPETRRLVKTLQKQVDALEAHLSEDENAPQSAADSESKDAA